MNHISSNENRKRKNPKEVKILKHSDNQRIQKHHQKTTHDRLKITQRKLLNKHNRIHQKVVSNYKFRNLFSVFSLEHMPGQSVNNHFHDPINNIALQRGQH